jgi:SAM-dependent methyltransferase
VAAHIESSMDRVIWQYWETVDEKPAFVDGLLDLARRNAGVPIIQITPETLADFLGDVPDELYRIKEVAHKADMIRAMLIQKYGGMWLDSDAIVLKDLNWLFDLLEDAEFVGFNDGGLLTPQRPWIRVNCFLSRPGGKVVSEWVAAQHKKFPKVEYEWQEIGTNILHPICLKYSDRVKILPFERICPIRWNEVARFSSRWRSVSSIIDDVFVVMLSNKTLEARNAKIRSLSVEQMRQENSLLSQFVKRAFNPNYRPPTLANNIYREVRVLIANRFNRLRFNNRDFWNDRYETNIEKGSGPGSRNKNLELKRQIVSHYIKKYQIESILDLGCGDIELIRDLDIKNYYGVDISDVVIKRNQTIRPDLVFERSNICNMLFTENADMVLCLDVLIHQKSYADYEAVIRTALDRAGKLALISGYIQPPEGWNVFFHEPLDRTIARLAPSAQISHLAAYRDTELFAVYIA